MKRDGLQWAGLLLAGVAWIGSTSPGMAQLSSDGRAMGTGKIKHVLLLSIDGMHAVDYYNCSRGVAGANGGEPYCSNMAALGATGINYTAASSTRPSDSFPGLTALISDSSPKTAGLYYDVAYDRSLDAPAVARGSGAGGGAVHTVWHAEKNDADNTQGIDYDGTKLNGGAPGAGHGASSGLRMCSPRAGRGVRSDSRQQPGGGGAELDIEL